MPGHNGGPRGDLFVDVEVVPDDAFQRESDDLLTQIRVSFALAALGGSVSLVLPDETRVTVDVPPGTQPGDVLMCRDKGFPHLGGHDRGLLKVFVQIHVPKGISPKAKDLLIQFERELEAAG